MQFDCKYLDILNVTKSDSNDISHFNEKWRG